MTLTQEELDAAVLDELAQDPVSLGYAGKTVKEKYDLLFNPTRTVVHGCMGKVIYNKLRALGVWKKLDLARDDAAIKAADAAMLNVDVSYKIKEFMDSCNFLRDDEIDLRPETELAQSLPYLVALGIVTPQDVHDFLALGYTVVNRAQELWGDDVSMGIGYFSRLLRPSEHQFAESEYDAARTTYLEKEAALNRLARGEDA